MADVDENTLRYDVRKLIEGTGYRFRVSAINDEGQGEPLETESEVKPEAPPGKVQRPVWLFYRRLSKIQ